MPVRVLLTLAFLVGVGAAATPAVTVTPERALLLAIAGNCPEQHQSCAGDESDRRCDVRPRTHASLPAAVWTPPDLDADNAAVGGNRDLVMPHQVRPPSRPQQAGEYTLEAPLLI